MAACDKMVKCWDLASNQTIQVAAHDAPVKTCHWVKGTTYTCLMTGSWDKTLKASISFPIYKLLVNVIQILCILCILSIISAKLIVLILHND